MINKKKKNQIFAVSWKLVLVFFFFFLHFDFLNDHQSSRKIWLWVAQAVKPKTKMQILFNFLIWFLVPFVFLFRQSLNWGISWTYEWQPDLNPVFRVKSKWLYIASGYCRLNMIPRGDSNFFLSLTGVLVVHIKADTYGLSGTCHFVSPGLFSVFTSPSVFQMFFFFFDNERISDVALEKSCINLPELVMYDSMDLSRKPKTQMIILVTLWSWTPCFFLHQKRYTHIVLRFQRTPCWSKNSSQFLIRIFLVTQNYVSIKLRNTSHCTLFVRALVLFVD